MVSPEEKLVSVIIPTFNRARILPRSVTSVLNQDYPWLELIIVDDASTDDTETYVLSLKDPRIRYYKLESNKGANFARNYGINLSSGEFIAFLDSDDEWKKNKLKEQVRAMNNSKTDVGCVCSNVIDVQETSRNYLRVTANGCRFQTLLYYNFIGTNSSPLIRKYVLEKTNAYDENLPANQDWDMWIRISKEFKIITIPDFLVLHYLSKDSISKNYWKKLTAWKSIIEKYWSNYDRPLKKFHLASLGEMYLIKGLFHNATLCFIQAYKTLPLGFSFKNLRIMTLFYKSLRNRQMNPLKKAMELTIFLANEVMFAKFCKILFYDVVKRWKLNSRIGLFNQNF